MTLLCTYEVSGHPCGDPVPKKNDHSGRGKMSFFDFISHGFCKIHARQMKKSAVDPEIWKIMLDRQETERREEACLRMERRET